MRLAGIIAAMFLVFGLAGCSLRGGGKSAKAAPPPPKPAPAASPKAPDAPLSVPQTQVQLPPPQPVNPLAVAAPQEPQEQAPEPAAATQAKPPRRPAPVAAAPKPVEPPPAAVVQPQPPVEERPRLQEIVSPEERKKLADQMAVRKKEIDEALRIAAARPLSDHDRNIVDRIKSFLQLSDQAGARGEMRQAEALSERALILARELRVAR